MKAVNQLINESESAWPDVLEWKNSAKNQVEILDVHPTNAQDALFKTQVTTRSPMGAIIYHSGGILVQNGWIRILGSGSEKLKRTLPDWNKGKSFSEFGEPPSYLLIADDVVGGFFAINGGGIEPTNLGIIYYHAPDTQKWESLGLNYSEFINFCFSGNVDDFYRDLRWDTWTEDVLSCNGDNAFSFFPFLFTEEGKDLNKTSKQLVPIEEIWSFHNSF